MTASRMPVMFFGSLTGMALGAMLVAAVCSGLERWVGFSKEPLALIPVGMLVGGVLGGVVGRRYA